MGTIGGRDTTSGASIADFTPIINADVRGGEGRNQIG
jgi:hypothetical protein